MSKPKRASAKKLHHGSVKSFLIAGIGASAGGLEAFTQLLKHLPAKSGMAFVLVQHLDPQHESALTSLLSRVSPMPVLEVTNNLRVEPNHVYVIPPNTRMAISGGTLKLSARHKDRGEHRSIDFFLESLARDQRERSIGVILSGTATDGTLGLEAIKAEGGITFAQDDSAKYDSMPRSAVAAGCVDFVSSLQNIAAELTRIAKHPFVADDSAFPRPGNPELERQDDQAASANTALASGGRGAPPTSSKRVHDEAKNAPVTRRSEQDGFKKVLLLLRNHCGVDFSLYKSSTIQRRVMRRVVLNRREKLGDYATSLKGNARELDALYSDVLISVTSFFRNPEAFEILKRKVFPKLMNQRREDPVRVWTVGCSTGQEAYSIAMAFAEYVEKIARAPKLQIFATDMNEPLLDKARQGLYAKTLAQDISPERLRRFFVEEGGGYRVSKTLREQVVFARQNLISDPPFSRVDLISCRNLMIYLEASLQKKIMPAFHYALKPHGFLFLGASESIGQFTDLFEPIDKKQKVFAKKSATTPPFNMPRAGVRDTRSSQVRRPLAAPIHSVPEGLRGEVTAQREADRLSVSKFAPPSVLINSELQVLQFRGPTSAYLEPPSGKASFDLLKMAREGLMLPLRSAINKAKKENKVARREKIRVSHNGDARLVNVEVVPLKNVRERCFLVLFEPVEAKQPGRATPAAPPPKLLGKQEQSRRVANLERELAETRDYLQAIQEQHDAANEELQASNEEVQSANEELQSINEELETSKEELESTNEELTTVNEEMTNQNGELARLNADLNNLQISIHTPLLLLGRDLTIRRFTPVAERLFNLLATDVGRPLSGVRHNLNFPALEEFVREVIDHVRPQEREVQDRQGHWYSLRARPYMTLDNKIDGAVLMLVDLNAIKRSEEKAKAARDYAEAMIRTARDSLLVLRPDLRVNSANDAFYKIFKTTPDQTEGRPIYELGNGQWNVPKLRELLGNILPRNSFFNDLEVAHDFPSIGHRTMLLDARRFEGEPGSTPLILLAVEDVTERLESRAALKRSEIRYRRLFETGKDGILILDSVSRKITDANPFMTRLLGFTREEFLGQELWQIGLLRDEQSSHAAFRELQQNGFIRYEDLPLQNKNGEKREVEVVANLYDEDGVKVIQCNIRDVTQRKNVEAQLAERARQQQNLYDFVGALNRDTGIETMCDAAMDALLICLSAQRAAILLYDPDGVMRFTAWRNLSEPYRRAAEGHSPWPRNAQSPQPICIGKLSDAPPELKPFLPALRSEGIAALDFFPLIYQGRLLGKFMVYYDAPHQCQEAPVQLALTISSQLAFALERKWTVESLRDARDRLSDQAVELEKLVGDRTVELTETIHELEAFSYSISHDLRAPLRAMNNYAQLLQESYHHQIDETGRRYLDRISSSSQRLDKLIQDVLNYARLVREPVPLVSLDLQRWIENIVHSYPDFQPPKTVIQIEGPLPPVLGNEGFLTQCIANLLSNAIKFVAPGVQPTVKIWAEDFTDAQTDAPFTRINFEDNGIGIAPENHQRIFRMFERIHSSAEYDGTGIGLTVARKAIERMGGKIGFESEPGRGTKFWIELQKSES